MRASSGSNKNSSSFSFVSIVDFSAINNNNHCSIRESAGQLKRSHGDVELQLLIKRVDIGGGEKGEVESGAGKEERERERRKRR